MQMETHTSVFDRDGMAVALTSTINVRTLLMRGMQLTSPQLVFGSRVMDPETGIIFNDEVI